MYPYLEKPKMTYEYFVVELEDAEKKSGIRLRENVVLGQLLNPVAVPKVLQYVSDRFITEVINDNIYRFNGTKVDLGAFWKKWCTDELNRRFEKEVL